MSEIGYTDLAGALTDDIGLIDDTATFRRIRRTPPRRASVTNPNAVCRSPTFLRLALGLVYFHFGVLKFFPDLSPAEMIATQTVMAVSGHMLDAHSAQLVLAVIETAVGLGFLFNILPKVTFVLFMLHMAGTFIPLVVLPEFTFKIAPLAPNVEGQYILKNLVFVAAGWTVLFPHLFPRTESPSAAVG